MKLAARVWAKVDADLVFPTAQGTPWDLSNARDELTRICAEAGIARITPHELRHSCASILNDRGVPLELIADLLGHVDTTMLARTYRHRLRPSADAAVEVMGALFGAPEAALNAQAVKPILCAIGHTEDRRSSCMMRLETRRADTPA